MIAPPYSVPRHRRRRVWALACLAALLPWVGWEAMTWPDVGGLAQRNPESDGVHRALPRLGDSSAAKREVEGRWVPYSRIAPTSSGRCWSSEDMRFFSHDGFDHRGDPRALERRLEEKTLPRGASTLTQQLAKNLWLSPSRNPLRKVKEAILTRQLEAKLPKRRILEIYLNVVEIGRPGSTAPRPPPATTTASRPRASPTARRPARRVPPPPRRLAPREQEPRATSGGVRISLRRMPRAWWRTADLARTVPHPRRQR